MAEKRYFVKYNGGLGGPPMHCIIHDDGRMDWSKHAGWGTKIEIPEKFWNVSINEVIAFFETGVKPRLKSPHG